MAINDALMSETEPLDKVELFKWDHFLTLPFKMSICPQLWKNLSASKSKKLQQPQKKKKITLNENK